MCEKKKNIYIYIIKFADISCYEHFMADKKVV